MFLSCLFAKRRIGIWPWMESDCNKFINSSRLSLKRSLSSESTTQISPCTLIVRLNSEKGSPRVCPDLSMDFVRLLFFKVFWMLINVQKKFLENSDFKVACKTVFWSGISNKIFFSNQKFSFLNVLKCHFWTLKIFQFLFYITIQAIFAFIKSRNSF